MKVSDSGSYYCSAVNGYGETRVAVELDVILKQNTIGKQSNSMNRPIEGSEESFSRQGNYIDNSNKPYRPILLEVTSSGTPGNRYTGDNVTIGCRFQSKPLPDIKWFFNQILIGQKQQSRKTPPFMSITTTTSGEIIESRLLLSNVQENSTGRYSCQASNRKGMRAGSTELTIPPGSRPKIIGEHPLNSTFIEGQTITLYCRVSSEEQPTINWVRKTNITEQSEKNKIVIHGFKAGQSLISGQPPFRQRLRSETLTPQVHYRGSNIYESILEVNHSHLNDSGLYMCTAWNPIDRAMAWREAHVAVIPLQGDSILDHKLMKSLKTTQSPVIEEDKSDGRFHFIPSLANSSLVDNPLVFWVIGLSIIIIGLIGVLISKMYLQDKTWMAKTPQYITDLELISQRKRLNASIANRSSPFSVTCSPMTSSVGKPGSTPPPKIRRKQFEGKNSNIGYTTYPKVLSAPALIHNNMIDDEVPKNVVVKPCNCLSCHQSQVERLKSLDRYQIQMQNKCNHERNKRLYSLQRRPNQDQQLFYPKSQSTTLSRNYFYPSQENPDEIQVIS